MSILETRRSIRRFSDEPVDRELIAEAVRCASFAPSWKNTQVVRYTAVESPEIRAKIANDCVMGFVGNTANILGCKVLVVVSVIHGRSGFERDGSYSTSKGEHWESFDAGAAAQTFCLAAHELGLGSVIMGIFDEKLVAEAVELPEGQIPAALIAVGFPAEEPNAPKRKSVDELLSWR